MEGDRIHRAAKKLFLWGLCQLRIKRKWFDRIANESRSIPTFAIEAVESSESIFSWSIRMSAQRVVSPIKRPASPKDKAGSEKSGHPYPIDLGFDLDIKARSFGLNIPTFITLYGNGYNNVRELDPVVDPNDSVIEFESSGSPKADATAENVPVAGQRK